MKKERRHWSADEKIKLLRRHLIENVPISKICKEVNLAPSLFHRWQEQLFQNAALALEGKRPERSQDQQHIENLRQALRMMIGAETGVQTSIDRGRRLGEAVLGASQDTAFRFIRGLLLLVFQTAMDGRIFIQVQQCVENREIIGLLETNHHQDESHLRYLESQVVRASEELSGLVTR